MSPSTGNPALLSFLSTTRQDAPFSSLIFFSSDAKLFHIGIDATLDWMNDNFRRRRTRPILWKEIAAYINIMNVSEIICNYTTKSDFDICLRYFYEGRTTVKKETLPKSKHYVKITKDIKHFLRRL